MKIGILTHYHNSSNYGGNLQAYALVSYLRSIGIDAEQVCYQRSQDYLFGINPPCESLLKKKFKQCIKSIMFPRLFHRYRKIRKFNLNAIPHSEKIYTQETICEIGEEYGIFISGSDQVWHPMAVCDAYLLNFPTQSKRISYAASFAVEDIPDKAISYYQQCLDKFQAISVREKKGQEIVKELIGKEAELVVDPTLLLSADEWNTIIEERPIKGEYLLCVYLGTEQLYRDLACEFANKKGFSIVTLPYMEGQNKEDKKFGDYRLFGVSPGELLYLIKNAACVFTDSFHVTVFSLIFRKNFMTFSRGTMGSRITSLLNMFGMIDRYCNTIEKMNEQYIEDNWQNQIRDERNFQEIKKRSIEFIKGSIL